MNVETEKKPVALKKNNYVLERIIGIDFGKGWGMFIIIVTHLYNYWGRETIMAGVSSIEIGGGINFFTVLMFPLIWQGTWACAFAFFTGASVAYTAHYQISEKGYNPKKRLMKSLISIFILFMINYLYIYFSMYPIHDINRNRQQGLIPASIKNGAFSPPSPAIFFIASPLSMVAFSDLFVSLTAYVLWRNGVDKRRNKQYRITFFCLGLLFLYLAEPMKNLLIPVLNEQYESQNYIYAQILAWLVGNKQCVFPLVSFHQTC